MSPPDSKQGRRVRRPKEHDQLLLTLTESGPFDAMRDVLVFAAALGWRRRRRKELGTASEPIRWDVMTGRRGAEALVNMIAITEFDSDLSILGDDRFADRILLFEEYANGGLEILGELLARSPKGDLEVIRSLVLEMDESAQSDVPDLAEQEPNL